MVLLRPNPAQNALPILAQYLWSADYTLHYSLTLLETVVAREGFSSILQR